jgi:hypothetical protein
MDRPITDKLTILCASFLTFVSMIEDMTNDAIKEVNEEVTTILEFF